jgi:hypothetical protein
LRSANALLAILFGIMLLCAGGAWWFWRHGEAFDCVDKVIETVPSPDGKYVAARWERSCGDAVATHVSLRDRGAAFSTVPDDDVFVARQGNRITATWSETRVLMIGARARSAVPDKAAWRDVRVRIDRLRCRRNEDCQREEQCLRHQDFADVISTDGTCEIPCDKGPYGKRCPLGYSCVVIDHGPLGRHCSGD